MEPHPRRILNDLHPAVSHDLLGEITRVPWLQADAHGRPITLVYHVVEERIARQHIGVVVNIPAFKDAADTVPGPGSIQSVDSELY